MNKKTITIRLDQKYIDLIEEIKKEAFHYYPAEDIATADVIRLSISYTAELYKGLEK